jgi:hypoxanthine-DNA glycosylase
MPTTQNGLDPIAGRESTVLILGSFPSPESLRLGQYYAFLQNRFWTLMQRICGVEVSLPYEHRKRGLKRNGIALWDSLRSCVRPGALDHRIVRGTESPNDFPRFFASHRSIRTVVFNGRKAEETFRRFVLPGLGPPATTLSLTAAPSTSPANTRYTVSKLERAWRRALCRRVAV